MGKLVSIVSNITSYDLSQFEAVFIIAGIYPNNHIIPAGSAEALCIENYILGGGSVYLEGGDVWYWDPLESGGHDFGPLFQISPVEDGIGDLATINRK